MLDVDRIKQANVVTFSGCQDNQTSADMSPSNPFMAPYGAFTTSMVRAVMADGNFLAQLCHFHCYTAENQNISSMWQANTKRILGRISFWRF